MQLTQMFDEQSERGIRDTKPGMAFWVGSGPSGKTCRGCKSFNSEDTYASGYRAGTPKPVPCAKYTHMMGRKGPKIQHDYRACKYFEARE